MLPFFSRRSPIYCGDSDVTASPRDRNRGCPCHLGGCTGRNSLSCEMEEDRWYVLLLSSLYKENCVHCKIQDRSDVTVIILHIQAPTHSIPDFEVHLDVADVVVPQMIPAEWFQKGKILH